MANYNFNVLVEDESGNPVQSATVTLTNSSGTQVFTSTTNSSGVLASNQVVADTGNTHILTISKTGYTTRTIYYEISYNDTAYYVRLNSYSTTYCQVSDIAQFLGFDSTIFSPTSTPTDEQVSNWILQNEQDIDDAMQMSWRSNTKSNEYYDAKSIAINEDGFVPIYVCKTPLRTFSSLSSDKIESWNSSSYTDYLTSKTEGRGNDYWVDYDKSVLYIKPLVYGQKTLRLTYRYGHTSVPENVKKLCIVKTALNFIDSDDRSALLPENSENNINTKRTSYLAQIKELENRLRKIKVV